MGRLLFIFLMLLVEKSAAAHKNNACKSYKGYLTIDTSEECFHIPDFGQNVTEIINHHLGSGVGETHEVTTEDGYTLSIFRIPRRNPKGVVVLQHPLFCDSRLWLYQNDLSTALVFYNQGYDVWLPNNRGTWYAQRHKTLSPKDEKFWDFSFHEMGLYDHKAVFDYIFEKTGQKIIFISHSMGGTSSLIYASLRPEDASRTVKIMVQLAPIVIMEHINVEIKIGSQVAHASKPLTRGIHNYSFFKYNSWYMKSFRKITIDWFKLKKIFVYILALGDGWTPNEFDAQYINMLFEQVGGEFSWKTLYHYSQIIAHGGRFQMYNYGSKENLNRYGSKTPPEYPLGNITVPNYIVYSTDDTVSAVKDNENLLSKLPKDAIKFGSYKISGINHIDYHFGKHRIEKVYNPVIKFLSNLSD